MVYYLYRSVIYEYIVLLLHVKKIKRDLIQYEFFAFSLGRIRFFRSFLSNGKYPRAFWMHEWMTSLSKTCLLLGLQERIAVQEANSFFYNWLPLWSVRQFLWEYSGKFKRPATVIQTKIFIIYLCQRSKLIWAFPVQAKGINLVIQC